MDGRFGNKGSHFEKYRQVARTGGTWAEKYEKKISDWDVAPNDEVFAEIFRVSKNQIIWGGNYFNLPPTRCFNVWRKLTISEQFSMAMCEYAWCSFNSNAKFWEFAPQDPQRFHPTQKPVELIARQIEEYAPEDALILDPFSGSGTTAIAAAADRLKVARTLLSIQRAVGAVPDGVFGQETASKLFSALGLGWPSQAEVRSGKSIFGKPGVESNLVSIKPPYPLYFGGKQLTTIRVHKLIAKAVETALVDVLDHYGIDNIKRLGLDKFDGAYNYRNSRGGSSLSMHAWGVALDWNAAKNPMNAKRGQASLSSPECEEWWRIWEQQGAVSLGRARNYDWMHVQFATL